MASGSSLTPGGSRGEERLAGTDCDWWWRAGLGQAGLSQLHTTGLERGGRQARETSQGENGGATNTPTVIITELYWLSRGYVRADRMCVLFILLGRWPSCGWR